MQLIKVTYKGPSATKPSRIVATNGRNTLTISYQYENMEIEKFEAAKAFVKKYMPLAPELDPTPGDFKEDTFFHFKSK